MGYSTEEEAPEIHAEVWVNDVLLSEPEWVSDAFQVLGVEIPPGVLREGENTLVLKNRGPSPYAVLILDRFEVRYPRKLVAEGGVLRGVFPRTAAAEVTSVDGAAYVLDVTEKPRWLVKTLIAVGLTSCRSADGRVEKIMQSLKIYPDWLSFR